MIALKKKIKLIRHYPLFHLVILHDGVDQIVDQIEDGWSVDVIHTLRPERRGFLNSRKNNNTNVVFDCNSI